MKINHLTVNEALRCYKCGGPCHDRKPLRIPQTNNYHTISLCPVCWELREFINGQAARVEWVWPGEETR